MLTQPIECGFCLKIFLPSHTAQIYCDEERCRELAEAEARAKKQIVGRMDSNVEIPAPEVIAMRAANVRARWGTEFEFETSYQRRKRELSQC